MCSTSATVSDLSQQKYSAFAAVEARRMRKTVYRRTIDYNASVMKHLRDRIWKSSSRSQVFLQPDYLYNYLLDPPSEYLDNPMNCVTGKLVRTSTNKNKCPIYCVCWTPEGRRLITGAYTGEFTLWNGLTFNFETILQAHEVQIRCMKWSHNDEWLLTADHAGYVKYWQANMNNVHMYQAHKMPIRGVSYSPSDNKFVTCSDDATVRVWDFFRCNEERALRGHGSDVRSIAWHPYKSLIISGSKDAQQPIKLWDPKTGESITTLYAHKNTCTDVAWNNNGNWFLTASRDHLIKLFDLRYMKTELQTFRGHKKEVTRVAWHPCLENLFASGSGDGAIHFWSAGNETELGVIDDAHDNMIWSLAWHPLGHILVSGGNDFTTKFWSRNRPGDVIKDANGTNNVLNGILNLSSIDTLKENSLKGLGREEDSTMVCLTELEPNVLKPPSEIPAVDIPGLNDGHPGPLVPDDEVEAETSKNRPVPIRPPGCISKEFIANWSSSRVIPKQGVVLSAVAAAKESGRDPLGVNLLDIDNNVAPLVSSDMCVNAKAKAAASEAAEYEARNKSRKFDSAAREEEMLAFANNLMPQASTSDPTQISTVNPQTPPPVQDQPLLPPPNVPRDHLRPSAPQQPLPPQRFRPPPPPQRFMGCPPPPRYPLVGGPPGGGYGMPPPPQFRRPPLPFRPPYEHQWGGPGPYNGPPMPGYGGPPPPKRPALQRPPPQQMRRGW